MPFVQRFLHILHKVPALLQTSEQHVHLLAIPASLPIELLVVFQRDNMYCM